MKITHRGKEIYVDAMLFRNFEALVQDVVNNVRDVVILIAGPERIGKSYGAKQFCFVLDYILFTNHNIDQPFTNANIKFGARDYLDMKAEAEKNKIKHHISVLDESKLDLDRKNRFAEDYRDFENYLSYCGSEYGFHFVLLPLWSDIQDYIILHRATLVVEFYGVRNKNSGEIQKGLYKVTSIPYTADTRIKGKNRAAIQKIIAWRYKHDRFDTLPNNVKAQNGKCLKGDVVDEAEYENLKVIHKRKAIYKSKKKDVVEKLSDKEKEYITEMPVHKMYDSKSKEYAALTRLQRKFKKSENKNSEAPI